MRISLLFNDSAGDGVAANELRGELERNGHQLVHLVEDDSHLARVLDGGTTDLLVAAGGDGTVARALTALAGRPMPLALIPIGTANNVARSLDIEGSVAEIVGGWRDARRLPFDVGSLRGQWGETLFVEAVGDGLVPAGIAAMERRSDHEDEPADVKLTLALRRYREVLGRLKPRRYAVSLDGTRVDEELLLLEVLNIRSIGPNLVFSSEADPTDGVFSVVTAGEEHRAALDDYLRHRIDDAECRLHLPTRHARAIEIEGLDTMHVDDRVRRWESTGSASIRIEAAAVEVLVPARSPVS